MTLNLFGSGPSGPRDRSCEDFYLFLLIIFTSAILLRAGFAESQHTDRFTSIGMVS